MNDDNVFAKLREITAEMKYCAQHLDLYRLAELKAQYDDAWQVEFANAKRLGL